MRSKKLIVLYVILGIVALFGLIILILTSTVWHTNLAIEAAQVDDSQNIIVNWEVSKPVDSVTIQVEHGHSVVYSTTLYNSNDVLKGSYTVPVYYGRQQVNVTVTKALFRKTITKLVDVYADEYNIAPITATFPVAQFTLSLDNITQSGTIPTFVWFKRSAAWDYSKMPNNVFTVPVASTYDITNNTNQSKIYAKTSEWIKELYTINSNSKFHLYYNDYYAYGWLQATIANGIPEENYNVVLLSDGTASYKYFNDHFDNLNHEAEYANMREKYNKLKQEIATRQSYTEGNKGFSISADKIREYAYVMAKEEENVEWWLARIDRTLAPNTKDNTAGIYSQVEDLVAAEKIKRKDLNQLLSGMSEEQKQMTKKLYHFSDDLFEKARQENKKIMVILGTWDNQETYFDAYVNATKKYYGSDYVYYYKGHPFSPTNSVNGKLRHLNKLGLIDIDSTIPAELIFYFNPEAETTGYASTTFISLNDEQSGGIFGTRKDDFSETYKNNIDFFMTKVSQSDETFGSLVHNVNCYLLEFTDTTDYEIAIYDNSANKIVYYKLVDGTYKSVKR